MFAHTKLNQFVRERDHPPFGHAGTTPRAGILEDEYGLGFDIEFGVVQATVPSVRSLNTTAGPLCWHRSQDSPH